MASVENLFLVAAALSAVVLAANSSPLMEILQADVPASPRGNLVAGERQPGDHLASNLAIAEAHSGAGQTLNIYKKIGVSPGQAITQIVAVDQSAAGDTQVSIVQGGPGHSSATLLFKNPQNTIQFAIQIFAK